MFIHYIVYLCFGHFFREAPERTEVICTTLPFSLYLQMSNRHKFEKIKSSILHQKGQMIMVVKLLSFKEQ